VDGIRVSGRNTQGVRIMNLTPGDLVVDVARVVKEDEGEEGAGDEDEAAAPAGRGAKGGGKGGTKSGGRK
jgi:DNA gyrase/topoisomerase IV subunit A